MGCKECNNGYIYYYNEYNEEVSKKCSCLIEKQEKKFKELVFRNSNLPKFIKTYNLSTDYLGDDENKNLRLITEFVNNFENYKNTSLYFYSNQRGNQKTTVSQYIVRELLYKKYKCKFMLMGDFINVLENEKFKEDDNDLRNELLLCDLLVLDDCFDKKKNNIYKSGYQLSFLDKFLRNRLEILNKSIIFTSNYSIDEIDNDSFGYDIPSLLKRNIKFYNYELEFKDNIEEYQIKNNNFSIDNLKNKLYNAIHKTDRKLKKG